MTRVRNQDNLGRMRMQLLAGYKTPSPEEEINIKSIADKLKLNYFHFDGRLAIELPPIGELTGHYIARAHHFSPMFPRNFEIGAMVQEFNWGTDAFVVCADDGSKLTPFWTSSSQLADPIPNPKSKRRSTARFIIWGPPEENMSFWTFISEWNPKHTTVLRCEVINNLKHDRLAINCILRDQGRPSRLSILNSNPELSPAIQASLEKARDAKDKSKDGIVRYGK